MSKYQAYPEYKDSGVKWLGKIPSHWHVIPIKYLANLNPRKSAIDRTLLNKECNFLPMEKLKLNSIVLDEKRLVSVVYDGYTYFEDGDVLMAKVTPCFENKNIAVASGLVNGVGFGSSEIYVLRSNEKTNSRFLYYRLQEDSFMDIATAAMTGAGGLKRVPSEVVNGYSLGTPELEEQTQIANFLDHETAKIDTLLEKQQLLIKLLKEKRQAVISHAVTKGLNPDAPMKDSGVEWLGEVPEHWKVTKIKYITALFEQGWSPQCDARPAEAPEYGVLKVGCVNHGLFKANENKVLPDTLEPKLQYLIQKDDLLISRANTKGLVGSAAVVDADYDHLLLCDKLYRLRLREGYLPELVSFYLSTSNAREQIELCATGASHSMQNIGQDTIKELFYVAPPTNEASDLLDYIRGQVNRFDQILFESNKQIELLKERRTALISAAVTGKIDVRNWQAPTSQIQASEQTTIKIKEEVL
ncbi:restriction endonuclease subunit S [Photobacterium sp. WH77]|uniref:restriction endonuclease subunit S n=1 Tax=unclassified Photobacterium TaxID=2628852 RepID=UPI001EDB33C7|nr:MULTISPECIES: restriction endonuclease subunit S [unclassified Photobacterium]MCG2835569.1 restriction endonuclease subunit S [Photobacterium sp. WH77]MCG2843182.1 restriction endonuclease subunit S [Photobacterium sp. WH80]